MKQLYALGLLLLFFSCGKEKVIHLPAISHSEITEINDVSPAYLFYDETKKDSVELNRKNLISTTNWLVNVDKRLTLKQVIPHIKYLQDKKLNSSHKKKEAKNYFTCNDTNRKNLGFIEFTDVVYYTEISDNFYLNTIADSKTSIIQASFLSTNDIKLIFYFDEIIYKSSTMSSLLDDIESTLKAQNNVIEIIQDFNENISFQDYISIKSVLSKLKNKTITLSNKEFILN